MNKSGLAFRLAAAVVLASGTFTGCETTDSGSTQVTSSAYYGVGFSDPWYYSHYDHDDDIIVTPPERPGSGAGEGLRPSNPIARPPDASQRPPAASQLPAAASQRPAARPMPSIPSTPRMSAGGGGGRGGGGGGGRR